MAQIGGRANGIHTLANRAVRSESGWVAFYLRYDVTSYIMGRAKIAITVDEHALQELDRLVEDGIYPNRSKAIEAAVKERIERLKHSRLATECAKLVKADEQALANEGYAGESEWPEY
jgi:Arc/MetJ-type ribon-helix-helix transcriptional regulator